MLFRYVGGQLFMISRSFMHLYIHNNHSLVENHKKWKLLKGGFKICNLAYNNCVTVICLLLKAKLQFKGLQFSICGQLARYYLPITLRYIKHELLIYLYGKLVDYNSGKQEFYYFCFSTLEKVITILAVHQNNRHDHQTCTYPKLVSRPVYLMKSYILKGLYLKRKMRCGFMTGPIHTLMSDAWFKHRYFILDLLCQ